MRSPKAMFSYTLRCGNSAYFWNTVFTSRLWGGRSFMRLPSSMTSPDVGVRNPPMIRSVVVLPQPDGPSSVTNSLSLISRSMFFRIFSPSNSTTMLRRLIIFSMISACLPSFFLRKYALFRQRTYQITVYNKIPDMSMIFLHKCRFF